MINSDFVICRTCPRIMGPMKSQSVRHSPMWAKKSTRVGSSVRPIIGLADNRLDRPGRSWHADYRLKILLIGHRPIVHMIGRLLT